MTQLQDSSVKNTIEELNPELRGLGRYEYGWHDADEIESADRPSMDNGWEVVKQLRPVMLTSRGGCATGVQEIWVNGKHIRLPLLPTGSDGPAAAEQLCQQHCPVSHVAHEFPQLCEAETEAIGRVLGRHVQRLATIAHGDGVCTTFIPRISKTSDNASASTAGRNPA